MTGSFGTSAKPQAGFTLIELMIAVAILAIVAAIAIPAYNAYIRESRLGATRMNLDTLRIAVEAFKLDDPGSSYKPAGTATSYVFTSASTTIKGAYGWEPEGGEAYSYTVTPTSTTYSLLAEQGSTFWVRCEKNPAANPSFNCCSTGDSGASKSACP